MSVDSAFPLVVKITNILAWPHTCGKPNCKLINARLDGKDVVFTGSACGKPVKTNFVPVVALIKANITENIKGIDKYMQGIGNGLSNSDLLSLIPESKLKQIKKEYRDIEWDNVRKASDAVKNFPSDYKLRDALAKAHNDFNNINAKALEDVKSFVKFEELKKLTHARSELIGLLSDLEKALKD